MYHLSQLGTRNVYCIGCCCCLTVRNVPQYGRNVWIFPFDCSRTLQIEIQFITCYCALTFFWTFVVFLRVCICVERCHAMCNRISLYILVACQFAFATAHFHAIHLSLNRPLDIVTALRYTDALKQTFTLHAIVAVSSFSLSLNHTLHYTQFVASAGVLNRKKERSNTNGTFRSLQNNALIVWLNSPNLGFYANKPPSNLSNLFQMKSVIFIWLCIRFNTNVWIQCEVLLVICLLHLFYNSRWS